MTYLKKYYLFILLVNVLIAGCDEWEDHNKATDEALTRDLVTTIRSTPELSTFAGLLASTGYDKELSASRKFTVWAPDNAALQNVDNAILEDPEKLKQFVANHISYQEYFTETPKPVLRIEMLSGKYMDWQRDGMEEAALIRSNQLAKNGVLHIIDASLLPKLNSWEAVQGTGSKHAVYLASLNYTQFVDSLATQTGVDPATGRPIYEPGTGLVERNDFLDAVANIREEAGRYTSIVLTDDAFDEALTQLLPYFKTAIPDQDSVEAASWFLTRDLVFEGVYAPDDLPETLTSLFGVKVPIDKNAIVETHYSSNGIVYVMNKVTTPLPDKFLPILVEGEKPTGFSRTDKALNTHYRYREFASEKFDLRIKDHSVALFNVHYRLTNVPSATYKVYWVAVNDFLATAFQQRLMIGSPLANTFPYVSVSPMNFEEIYLGDYTVNKFGTIDLFLVGANSTNNTLNPLVLDYIKLVPVF